MKRLTEEQEEQIRQLESNISACQQLLRNTDYQAIKHAEGALSDEEFAKTKAKREGWRAEINDNQAQIAEIRGE